jgi:hypothetical protein
MSRVREFLSALNPKINRLRNAQSSITTVHSRVLPCSKIYLWTSMEQPGCNVLIKILLIIYRKLNTNSSEIKLAHSFTTDSDFNQSYGSPFMKPDFRNSTDNNRKRVVVQKRSTMWILTRLRRYRVVRTTTSPYAGSFGRMKYKYTWVLESPE